ncbi:hypothetical protein [Nocardia fluminea]|uniref:hypothetical protein n=1 Tax=Nocardia fluminea TaxID=134984 RepID=UPI003D0E179E
MAGQGHYNHYDDPDEFWDEEPLEIRRSPAPSVPASAMRRPAAHRDVDTHSSKSRIAEPPNRNGSVDDIDLQQAQFDRLRAVAQQRIETAMAEVRAQIFAGVSTDRSATARVSSSGVVLSIELTRGFGDFGQPAWMVADTVNSTARAIVEAVKAARTAAAGAVARQLAGDVRHQ